MRRQFVPAFRLWECSHPVRGLAAHTAADLYPDDWPEDNIREHFRRGCESRTAAASSRRAAAAPGTPTTASNFLFAKLPRAPRPSALAAASRAVLAAHRYSRSPQ